MALAPNHETRQHAAIADLRIALAHRIPDGAFSGDEVTTSRLLKGRYSAHW